jgi:hypothetical protein
VIPLSADPVTRTRERTARERVSSNGDCEMWEMSDQLVKALHGICVKSSSGY